MANVIKHKRGTSTPAATDFTSTGELLVNTSTGAVFNKLSGGSVHQVGSLINNKLEVKSDDSSPGRIDFYCEVNNAHYTRLKAAAHSTYSGNADVVLPNTSGTLLLQNGDGSSLTSLTGASQGSYGDATNVPTISVDANGRITGISNTSISVGQSNQNAFSIIAVSGQTNVEADTTTDTVTFVAGSNMTITTNATGDTVTFASSGGGGSSNLSGLSDVTITSPTNGQVLKYNGTAWVNDADATGGGSSDPYQSNAQSLTSNQTIPASTNAAVFGPSYTVASGVTLTISTGSFFSVL